MTGTLLLLLWLTLHGVHCHSEVLISEGGVWDSGVEGDQAGQMSLDGNRGITQVAENHRQVHIPTQLDLEDRMERE